MPGSSRPEGTQAAGGSRNVRASELTNVAAREPGTKPMLYFRVRLRGSIEPQE